MPKMRPTQPPRRAARSQSPRYAIRRWRANTSNHAIGIRVSATASPINAAPMNPASGSATGSRVVTISPTSTHTTSAAPRTARLISRSLPSMTSESRVYRPAATGLSPARRARRADVAERAAIARHRFGRRLEAAGADARRGLRDAGASLGHALRIDVDPPDQPGVGEMERDMVGQPAGHRLVAHRVDLELERLTCPLASLGRVADIGRLVVGDRHSLATHDPERRGDDVGSRRRRLARLLVTVLDGHDVDPVPSTAHAVAVDLEGELALD